MFSSILQMKKCQENAKNMCFLNYKRDGMNH